MVLLLNLFISLRFVVFMFDKRVNMINIFFAILAKVIKGTYRAFISYTNYRKLTTILTAYILMNGRLILLLSLLLLLLS